MFSIDYKNDRYEVAFPDDSRILLPKDVEDTKPLRRELAKLSHRIAAREHIKTHQDYIPNWPLEELTPTQLQKLTDLYFDVNPDDEIWKLLDIYEHPSHEKLAHYERELVKEKELLNRMNAKNDEKNPQA